MASMFPVPRRTVIGFVVVLFNEKIKLVPPYWPNFSTHGTCLQLLTLPSILSTVGFSTKRVKAWTMENIFLIAAIHCEPQGFWIAYWAMCMLFNHTLIFHNLTHAPSNSASPLILRTVTKLLGSLKVRGALGNPILIRHPPAGPAGHWSEHQINHTSLLDISDRDVRKQILTFSAFSSYCLGVHVGSLRLVILKISDIWSCWYAIGQGVKRDR